MKRVSDVQLKRALQRLITNKQHMKRRNTNLGVLHCPLEVYNNWQCMNAAKAQETSKRNNSASYNEGAHPRPCLISPQGALYLTAFKNHPWQEWSRSAVGGGGKVVVGPPWCW